MPEHHKIQGVVLDSENNPVKNVWVRIYRGFKEIGKEITTSNGAYEVKFDEGSPITMIRYDHLLVDLFERRHPTIALSFSGMSSHSLGKMMPDKVGGGYDQQALLDMLSAYEHLYVIDVAGDLEGMRGDLHERYKQNIGMMKHVDSITEQRLEHVTHLYNKDQY